MWDHPTDETTQPDDNDDAYSRRGSSAFSGGAKTTENRATESRGTHDFESRHRRLLGLETKVSRIYKRKRRSMFAPARSPIPPLIPPAHIDVMPCTRTNLDYQDENFIEDMWDGSDSDGQQLNDGWVGEIIFYMYFKEPKGYRMVQGRLTHIQETT